jgi:hypothetical protein
MEDLVLYFFRGRPEAIGVYLRFRPVAINIFLLAAVCTGLLAGSDKIRSFSLGLAAGVLLVKTGESIGRLRNSTTKKLPAGNEC